MIILVTGASGQLGSAVIDELKKRNIEYLCPSSKELDITDEYSVCNYFCDNRPDIVIHCAGWTAVDKAEMPENKDIVYTVNVIGTKNVAEQCAKYDIKLMYISSDYVFGNCPTPHSEDEENLVPLNYYGFTKQKGEEVVKNTLNRFFIVRVSWLFGKSGSNFVDTMVRLGSMGKSVRVVNDQVGRPTYTIDVAPLLLDIALSEKYGCYHATNSGEFISWFDLAREVYTHCCFSGAVCPISSSEYSQLAKRPQNSALLTEKLITRGFYELPHWRNALHRYLHAYHNSDAKLK